MTRSQLNTLLDAKLSYWELSDPHPAEDKPERRWRGKNGNPAPEHYTVRALSIDADGVSQREYFDVVRVGDEWFLSRGISARPDMPASRKPDPARP